jgi:IclR family KDG regulon transcriptional repressor
MSTIEKALNIMETILKQKDEVSLADLAKLTGINITTVHRACTSLTNRGYLYQKEKGGKYSLGVKLLQFNYIANTGVNIKEEAYPFLKILCDEITETVILAVLDGVEPIDIVCILPDKMLQAAPGIGTKSPFHCTSVGKIFLANMSDERIEGVIGLQGLKVYTDFTINDMNRLKTDLETIRQDGIAFDDEEYILGLRSAAAPVYGEQGNLLAAVAFLAPSTRISSLKLKQLAPMVKHCADEISRALGRYQRKNR